MTLHFSRCAPLLVCLSACTQAGRPAAEEPDSVLAAYVAAQADSGAAAWNRGDLVAFLAPYADSVEMVFPEGPVLGRNRVEALQRANVAWNGARPDEQARIGKSQLRRLAPEAAVQTVEVILRRATGEERRIWTTTVWRRTPAGWRVVHEQSF